MKNEKQKKIDREMEQKKEEDKKCKRNEDKTKKKFVFSKTKNIYKRNLAKRAGENIKMKKRKKRKN